MTKIKFCGLSRRCDIEAVNELKPEYIGFVFVKTSKRYVSFEKAEELKSLLDPKIKAVGVFVNEDLKRIEEICDKKVIDIVQLHGLEEEKELTPEEELAAIPKHRGRKTKLYMHNTKKKLKTITAKTILMKDTSL